MSDPSEPPEGPRSEGETKEPPGAIGEMIPKGKMLIRKYVGTATDGEYLYDLDASLQSEPMIKSKLTGKTFVLRWEDMIKLAQDAGIDSPDQS
jgi:hypothetical protein